MEPKITTRVTIDLNDIQYKLLSAIASDLGRSKRETVIHALKVLVELRLSDRPGESIIVRRDLKTGMEREIKVL